MLVFLSSLVDCLDLSLPSWQENCVLLMDGATYHTGSKVREYIRKLKLDVIYSGPYSYDDTPIELVFGHLKLGELNTEQQATGKKKEEARRSVPPNHTPVHGRHARIAQACRMVSFLFALRRPVAHEKFEPRHRTAL